MLSEFIYQQRKKNNLTQEFLASKIGVSRPTYVQIEQGKRDLTITEAEKLADIFGISFENFRQAKAPRSKVVLERERPAKKSAAPEVRISVPQKNLKKFKEVLLYILERTGARPNIGETALYKLMYFIDFDYYEKFEEQLIGATYIKNHFGPTPIEFQDIVADMRKKNEIEPVKSKYFQYDQKKYLPRRSPDLTQLSAQEIYHIDNVLANKSAKELSEYSHGDIPWKTHQNGETLDYESVFYRDDKYSVREYADEL